MPPSYYRKSYSNGVSAKRKKLSFTAFVSPRWNWGIPDRLSMNKQLPILTDPLNSTV